MSYNTRSRSCGRKRSRRDDRGDDRRDVVELFNEFRETFDPDALSVNGGDNEENQRDIDIEVQPAIEPEEAAMPAWAKTLIDAQNKALDENKKQLSELRTEIRALKRKREDEKDTSIEWKTKGNKKQFEFNRSVEDRLEQIGVCSTLLEARTLAEEGLTLLSKRNKLNRIADAHGWDTVNLYMSDPLAKDDADDKKLRKAIKDAEKSREKAKKEKETKSRRSARARDFGAGSSSSTSSSPSVTHALALLPHQLKESSFLQMTKNWHNNIVIGVVSPDTLAEIVLVTIVKID